MKTNGTEYLDRDIYYVEETTDGRKELNVQRCYYDNGYDINITEYCGVRLSIPIAREDFVKAVETSKQYGGAVSFDRQKAMKEIRKDVANAQPLPIEEVNENTPCGMYIDL